MIRLIAISLSVVLILGLSIIMPPDKPVKAAGVWNVEPGDSIQDVIDEAIAAGGGTIYFAPGFYGFDVNHILNIGPSGGSVTKLELIGTGATLNDLYDYILYIMSIQDGSDVEQLEISGTVLETSIHIKNVDYPVTVQGFGIFNARAEYQGVPGIGCGIYVVESNPTISDCMIFSGGAPCGGGMYNVNSSPIVTNTIFILCQAGVEGCGSEGGAMCNVDSSPLIINSAFLYNVCLGVKAPQRGGAICNYSSSTTLINCTLFGNVAQFGDYTTPRGQAIYNSYSSTTLRNCISWGHQGEYIFYNWGPSDFTFSYCDTDNVTPGDGNISTDPVFVYDAPLLEDLTLEDILLLDFRLQDVSPCIDAGDNSAVPAWCTTDIDGNPRIDNGIVDMGAYEFMSELGPLEVFVDIKPGGCPNPLNVRSKGVLPLAILGTADFDVSEIDPESVALAFFGPGSEPFDPIIPPDEKKKPVADVGTPYDGELVDCLSCLQEGPDGFPDLLLKFDTQAIVAGMGEVADGACISLTLTGSLYDGTPFSGSDIVRIINKGKK